MVRTTVVGWHNGSRAGLVCLVLWSPVAAVAEQPADISLILRSRELQAKQTVTGSEIRALADSISSFALLRVDELARSRGYPEWFSSTNPVIQYQLKAAIENSLKSGDAARTNLATLVDEAVSGRLAEQVMALAAGVAPPSRTSAATWRPAELEVRVEGGANILRLQPEGSSVLDERGMVGNGNGRLDPGEFANLSLQFVNAGSRRLQSGSLYVEGSSECVLLGSGEQLAGAEIQLPELNPGASGRVIVPVFVSRECAGETVTLRLRAHDTWEFPGGLKYDLSFVMQDVDNARIERVQLDSDDFGHSEDGDNTRLDPGERVELSASLRLRNGRFRSVRQTFLVPSPLEGRHTPGSSPVKAHDGAYIADAFDDVDITVPTQDVLNQGLSGAAAVGRWKVSEDAVLFVAVDSVLEEGDQVPHGAGKTVAHKTGASVKKGGKPAGGSIPGSAAGLGPSPMPRDSVSARSINFDAKQLEAVLAAHIAVTPLSSLESEDGPQIGLPVDGFRVTVPDATAFAQALSVVIPAGSSASIPPSDGDDAAGSGVTYRVRHYLPIKVAWEPKSAGVTCEFHTGGVPDELGVPSTVRVMVQNAPAGSEPSLRDSNLGSIELSDASDNSAGRGFVAVVRPETAGPSLLRFSLADADGREVCSAAIPYQVSGGSNQERLVDSQWPRTVSLEVGGLVVDSSMSGSAVLTMGRKLRFVGHAGNRDFVDFTAFGGGLGLRYTGVVPFGARGVMEPSVQVAAGLYGKSTSIEGSLGVSVHRGVGPFINMVGGTNDYYGSFLGVNFGLGFYFPTR